MPMPSEIARAAAESRDAAVDAAIASAKKGGADPDAATRGGKTPGWKEVWQKNIQKWNSALSPAATTAGTAAGLSSTQSAAAEGGAAYPSGEEADSVQGKKEAMKAPFSRDDVKTL